MTVPESKFAEYGITENSEDLSNPNVIDLSKYKTPADLQIAIQNEGNRPTI